MQINWIPRIFLVLVIVLFAAGCATEPINWNRRIGTYTYAQAVTEFGPPDRRVKFITGELVAEWDRRYYGASTAGAGAGSYGYPGGAGVAQTGPVYYESTLRLTFATNNILTGWDKD